MIHYIRRMILLITLVAEKLPIEKNFETLDLVLIIFIQIIILIIINLLTQERTIATIILVF